MCIPTAIQMAKSLSYLSTRLLENRLISEADSILSAASRLRTYGNKKTWEYCINKSNPLIFSPLKNPRLNLEIYPKIFIDVVADEEGFEKRGFPFRKFNMTLEIVSLNTSILIHRSHIDLANQYADGNYQEGPIFHLQFGGNTDQKVNDEKVFQFGLPRWLHPPMDLILISELVIANFYKEKWVVLKNQKDWVTMIKDSQSFCYRPLIDFAIQNFTEKSLLNIFWANDFNNN